MPFTKEDKILIKNLFELKGYNGKHLHVVREFSSKGWNAISIYKVLQYLWFTGLVDRPFGSARWRIGRIDLVDKLVFYKKWPEEK